MARIGPNQDINDPITIIDLAYKFQQQSNRKGDFLAQSNAQNPNVTGSPICDISIPFKMINGSIQSLQGDNIDYDEGYIYNTDLVSNATIITYINLAEQFRDYWKILNNILDQLNDYDYLQEIDIEPEEIIVPDGSHGTLGGTKYIKTSYSHLPSESLSIPEWKGIGPINYNQLTYPQLLSQLQTINVERNISEEIAWETNYLYSKAIDDTGDVRGAAAGLGSNYIQFYNNTLSPINISLFIDITAIFDSRFDTSYSSWAEISGVNCYPTGNVWLLPSYISYNEEKLSPGGTTTLSTNRTIEIPPKKSAFIGASAGAGTTFGSFLTIGTVNIEIVVKDQTLTYLVDVAN